MDIGAAFDEWLTATWPRAGWAEILEVDGLRVGRVAGRRVLGRPGDLVGGGAPRAISLDAAGMLGVLVGVPAGEVQRLLARLVELPPPAATAEQWVVTAAGELVAGTAPLPDADIAGLLAQRARRAQLGCHHVVVRPCTDPHFFVLDGRPAVRAMAAAVLLSPMQLHVAGYAAAGATVAEIAVAVDRSEETVRTHLRAVYRRMEVSSRLELARVVLPRATGWRADLATSVQPRLLAS